MVNREQTAETKAKWNRISLNINSNNTNLPWTPSKPVPVHLPPANSQRCKTVAPPQLIAALDYIIPVSAGERGPAQTPDVQLTEDPHAHLSGKGLCKAVLERILASRDLQGGSSLWAEDGALAPFYRHSASLSVLEEFQFYFHWPQHHLCEWQNVWLKNNAFFKRYIGYSVRVTERSRYRFLFVRGQSHHLQYVTLAKQCLEPILKTNISIYLHAVWKTNDIY